MQFIFGERTCKTIYARNLEEAISIFQTTVLFPEKHVGDKYIESCDYNDAYGRNEYKFKSNPKIIITDENDKEHEITLKDCIDVDFNKLSHVAGLLETSESTDDNSLPVVNSKEQLQTVTNKMAFREMSNDIDRKKYELKLKMRELEDAQNLMMAELKQKSKLIYIL